jgi:NitT/TauT family transport system permease protein
MRSTTSNKPQQKKAPGRTILSVCFWILVWEVAAKVIGNDIFLVSPLQVLLRLFRLAKEVSYWKAILFSLVRIASGFFLATILGILFAFLAYRSDIIRSLLSPLVKTIKSIPVASFIILVLLWVSSRNLSICISFLMVFPVMYGNVLEGLDNTSKELLEMADVFRIPMRKRLTTIYLSSVMPFFHSACTLGLGLAWKSGIAAEVIGIPVGSMGESLYQAKIFLATGDLFAWTLTIVLVSVSFEKLMLLLFDFIARKLECAT